MGTHPVRAWALVLAASAAVASAVRPLAAADDAAKPARKVDAALKDAPAKPADSPKPGDTAKPSDAAKAQAAMAEMAEWEKAQRVGPEHKRLTAMAGAWDCVVVTYMPDGSTAESKGRERCRAILGGRFLESQFEGDMMGMGYTGRGLLGYDNVKKKYVMTWADSMSTGIMAFEGTADDAARTMTLTATQVAPGGKAETWRAVTTVADDTHHTFDMHVTKPGEKEAKVMTIKYTRAADEGGQPKP
jgi:hypothetical protein